MLQRGIALRQEGSPQLHIARKDHDFPEGSYNHDKRERDRGARVSVSDLISARTQDIDQALKSPHLEFRCLSPKCSAFFVLQYLPHAAQQPGIYPVANYQA